MIGILVVTHGQVGRELIGAVDMILGPQNRMAGVAVEQKDDMPTAARTIERAFESVDEGDGVLIFTDLLGGTPSNVSLTLLNKPKVEVISGVNLPMLLKAAGLRTRAPLEKVAEEAFKAGRQGVTAATMILETNPHEPGPGKG